MFLSKPLVKMQELVLNYSYFKNKKKVRSENFKAAIIKKQCELIIDFFVHR
jgi:hypothetical protein